MLGKRKPLETIRDCHFSEIEFRGSGAHPQPLDKPHPTRQLRKTRCRRGVVRGTGVFQLRLRSFRNDLGIDNEGRCCSGFPTSTGRCSGFCRTKIRVCLKHYQSNIDHTTPCTFGEYVTPVLGNNSLKFNVDDEVPSPDSIAQKVIEFSLNVTWPGTFSLIMETWHDGNSSSSSNSPTARSAIYKQGEIPGALIHLFP
ncbi:unnamed protein product [Notodromas monacha]|uniref:Notch ligand N-terminal domain-containing protein n=1 Tax=Notodromas monacha TaxID=399045 RepID=A0A7R9G950_9CRUS|nr:unnamed protein product [Notodromas monacha]CAG0912469.1 unnamed protein product [Notodromas monacha]